MAGGSRCVVCHTEPDSSCTATTLTDKSGRELVERYLRRQPGSLSSQNIICNYCKKYINDCVKRSSTAHGVHEKSTEGDGGGSAAKTALKIGLPMAGGIAGAAVAVVAAPVVVAGLGFGAGGIAAGSTAASMMSMSATTGVGAGVVAAFQSAGAAGIGLAGNALLAVGGGSAGGLLGKVGAKLAKGKTSQLTPLLCVLCETPNPADATSLGTDDALREQVEQYLRRKPGSLSPSTLICPACQKHIQGISKPGPDSTK